MMCKGKTKLLSVIFHQDPIRAKDLVLYHRRKTVEQTNKQNRKRMYL